MSRFDIWADYISDNFCAVRTCTSEDWKESYNAFSDTAKGLYIYWEPAILIRVDGTHTINHFKTLLHELGHHLVREGFISYKDNWWVRHYFKQIPKEWILNYPSWEREEEVIVESFARWGLDFTADKEVNKGFKDFLISIGAAPPPF